MEPTLKALCRRLILPTLGMAHLFLMGCSSIPLKDGRIPEEHLNQIQSITGKYRGPLRLQTLDGVIDDPISEKVEIDLVLQDQSLRLKATTDLAGPQCDSKVGSLKNLSAWTHGDTEVVQGHFEFDRGRCVDQIKEDDLLFTANRKKGAQDVTLTVSLIKDYVKTRGGRAGSRPLNITAHLSKTK